MANKTLMLDMSFACNIKKRKKETLRSDTLCVFQQNRYMKQYMAKSQ